MKTVASKILVLHMFSGYEYFKAVLKSSLPSQNQKLSCIYIVLSESIYSSICNWSKLEYKSEYYLEY